MTQHVCAEPDFPITGLLTGTEIEALSEEALGARLAQGEGQKVKDRTHRPNHQHKA